MRFSFDPDSREVRTYGAFDQMMQPYSATDARARASQLQEADFSGEESGARARVRRWKKTVLASVGISIVLGAVIAVVSGRGDPAEEVISIQQSETNLVEGGLGNKLERSGPHRTAGLASTPLDFTALNFYHIRDGKPAQGYPWLQGTKLIEPYRETSLSVVEPRPDREYQWTIFSGQGSGQSLHQWLQVSGPHVKANFTHLDENTLVLEESDANGRLTRRLEEVVIIKYVRREIRTLTDEDREELFDAMFKLWEVSAEDGPGKELYGEDYADIWAINRLHFKATVAFECDRFHDGLGFLLSHLIITNTFEYSLQLVNPKLTLPYWDFTIEESTSSGETFDPSRPITRSPILQSSWFGFYDEEDLVVKDGRWAFTKIPVVEEDHLSDVDADVYNRLRAPWNANARPYLVRGMGALCQVNMQEMFPWPTCETHFDLVMSNSDFYSWCWDAQHDPHGPVHAWLGGMIDCKDKYDVIADLVGKSVAQQLAYISVLTIKELYRAEVYKCEGTVAPSVEADEIFSSGTCGCLDYDLTRGDDYKKVLAEMSGVPLWIADFDEDIQRQVVDVLCNTVVVEGDHQQASSSLDPSFWPIHPTMDRLWQFSVLTESVTDFEWPDTDYTYEDSEGVNVSEVISTWSATCEGHGGSDVFPFGMRDTGMKDFKVRTGIRWDAMGESGNTLTNREAMKAFDPRVNALNYVYDNFNWDHCTADGYDFDEAWAQTASKPRSPVFKEGTRRFPQNKRFKQFMGEL